MRTIFLADAHLRHPDDTNYRLLLRFLEELAGTTETLYLMGDLFDFWVGFPGQPLRHYDPVLSALQRLVEQGCRLVCFEGNHDFHLGPIFTERLRAVVYTGPAELTIQGKRYYLCHGDQLNRRDYSYRLLRLLLRNPLTRLSVRVFPPGLAERIRQRLQRASRRAYGDNARRWDYRRILEEKGSQLQRAGFAGLVTGHFHLALCERLGPDGFTLLSLGDWMEAFTYGEIRDGELSLRQYSPADPSPPSRF